MEQGLRDAAEARETQGIWKTVGGGVLAVVGTVVCIAATGGASTPSVVAGWGAGGGTAIFGVSSSIEGAQDIYYGSMGDIDSTAINQLKDVIFQRNEDAYYFAENIFAFAASAFIPISHASVAGNLTFRSGTTIVAKEGLSMLAGEGASNITMKLTDNQTASMLAGMLASGVTAQGLNGIDAKFHILGDKGGSKSVNTLTAAQKSRLNSLENTINDHLTEGDFSGALRDLQGKPVPNGRGGYFDHLGEMKDSYVSLKKIKRGLEGSLKNPNLSDIDRALLQEGLDKTNTYILRIQELFKPYGGIE